MKAFFRKISVLLTLMGFVLLFAGGQALSADYLDIAKQTGIEIIEKDGAIMWSGKYGGQMKPEGPLAGKKIAVFASSEFSDYQAYYFMSFIGEFGGLCEFVLNNNHLWKEVRPNFGSKTPHGMWGLSLDPVPVLAANKVTYKYLMGEDPADPMAYDALMEAKPSVLLLWGIILATSLSQILRPSSL